MNIGGPEKRAIGSFVLGDIERRDHHHVLKTGPLTVVRLSIIRGIMVRMRRARCGE
ncbi:hypothetical protein ACLOJK_000889, partial [Asimina triloba]